MGDIARSVAVLGAIILALFGLGRLLTVTPDEPTRSVDYRTAVESSRTVADFDVLAPAALPDGWRATSVRFEQDSWHLGVVTAGDDYVGLEQVKAGPERALKRFANGSRSYGDTVVGGVTWSLHTGPRDNLTYVRRDGDMMVVVTGTAPRHVMESYISSLSASS